MLQPGQLITNCVHLQSHEQAIVDFLLQAGYNITLLPTSRVKNMRTPDFLLDDQPWEAKTLFKSRRPTMEHAFKSALKQAPNVIFDLRFLPGNDQSMQKYILPEFNHNYHAQRVLIITKDQQILRYRK